MRGHRGSFTGRKGRARQPHLPPYFLLLLIEHSRAMFSLEKRPPLSTATGAFSEIRVAVPFYFYCSFLFGNGVDLPSVPYALACHFN